jgi:hypothetical protein
MDRIEITGSRNENKSLGSLISGIFQDAQTLIAKEIAAAKLELKQEMSKGIKAGVSLGIGGFLLVVGFILLTLMIVFLISTYTPIPLWGSGFSVDRRHRCRSDRIPLLMLGSFSEFAFFQS